MDADTRRALTHLTRWLARRDHSTHELAQKLLTKGYTQPVIDAAIAHFQERGLINETRFVENYLSFRRSKGFGPLRIANELKMRGIAADKIAEALQIADNQWLIVARRVWQKQFKGLLPKNFNDRAKQMRFLLYRGFTQEHIQHIITDQPE